jgi:hypothetical protein
MLRNSGVNHLENQKKNRYLKMGGIPQGPQTTGLEFSILTRIESNIICQLNFHLYPPVVILFPLHTLPI